MISCFHAFASSRSAMMDIPAPISVGTGMMVFLGSAPRYLLGFSRHGQIAFQGSCPNSHPHQQCVMVWSTSLPGLGIMNFTKIRRIKGNLSVALCTPWDYWRWVFSLKLALDQCESSHTLWVSGLSLHFVSMIFLMNDFFQFTCLFIFLLGLIFCLTNPFDF